MTEQMYMNVLLSLSKNMVEILFHGTIESSEKKVLSKFDDALDEYLDIQAEIFQIMEQKGWYTIKKTKDTNKEELINKYSKTNID